MSYKKLAIATTFCLMAANSFASDGTITFSGALIESGCTLVGADASQNLIVPMGTYAISALSDAGDKTPNKRAKLEFENCPKNESGENYAVDIAFSGETDADGKFAVTHEGAPANGLALSLLTAENNVIEPSVGFPLTVEDDGKASFELNARFEATETSAKEPGDISSTVNLTMSYN